MPQISGVEDLDRPDASDQPEACARESDLTAGNGGRRDRRGGNDHGAGAGGLRAEWQQRAGDLIDVIECAAEGELRLRGECGIVLRIPGSFAAEELKRTGYGAHLAVTSYADLFG